MTRLAADQMSRRFSTFSPPLTCYKPAVQPYVCLSVYKFTLVLHSRTQTSVQGLDQFENTWTNTQWEPVRVEIQIQKDGLPRFVKKVPFLHRTSPSQAELNLEFATSSRGRDLDWAGKTRKIDPGRFCSWCSCLPKQFHTPGWPIRDDDRLMTVASQPSKAVKNQKRNSKLVKRALP